MHITTTEKPMKSSCRGRALPMILAASIIAVGGAMLLQASRRAEQAGRSLQEQTKIEMQKKAAEEAERDLQARQQEQDKQSRTERAYREADALLQRWEDANALAAAAPRMNLADRVSALQALAREADALVLPACMNQHQSALIKSMRGVVDGYLAFMQDANLGKLVAQASIDDGRAALQSFRLGLSACRSGPR